VTLLRSVGTADHALHDGKMSAALMRLPRGIIGANRIRWCYAPLNPALAGNYAIGIHDASGRLIVDTGGVAFVASAASIQPRAEVITATDFEPGTYWITFGVDTTAGQAKYHGVDVSTAAGAPSTGVRNTAAYHASAAYTTPDSLSGMTDIGPTSGTLTLPPVPIITVSAE
jgi:hypothetical protein